MDKVFLSLSEYLNSAVFVLLAILLAAMIAIWKVSAFIAKWQEKKWQEKESDLKELKTILYPMKAALDEVVKKVDALFTHTHPNSPIKSQSPISLTDVGKEMVEAMDVEKTLDQHEEELEKSAVFKDVDNAYDLQDACFTAMAELKKLLSDDQLKKVKDEAFNRGLPLENVLSVYAVVLRDRLLAKRGWSPCMTLKNRKSIRTHLFFPRNQKSGQS